MGTSSALRSRLGGWVQLQQVEKWLGKLLAEDALGVVGTDGFVGVGANCGRQEARRLGGVTQPATKLLAWRFWGVRVATPKQWEEMSSSCCGEGGSRPGPSPSLSIPFPLLIVQ